MGLTCSPRLPSGRTVISLSRTAFAPSVFELGPALAKALQEQDHHPSDDGVAITHQGR